MALKECPTCREMIRASSKSCRACGHAFDTSTLVKSTTSRCPLCGKLADAGAGACECGYDFSTRPIDLREQLVRRKRYGWFWIGSGILVVVAVGGLLAISVMPILAGVLVAASGAALIARGIRSISWTRGELAAMNARDKALPTARVVE